MKKLSTGQNSTLGEYRKLCMAVFGKDSAAVTFLDQKIEEQGEDEEVLADEGQMVYLLGQEHLKGLQDNILGYKPTGAPIHPIKTGMIATACIVTCVGCHKVIRGMGGPIQDALCIECWDKQQKPSTS